MDGERAARAFAAEAGCPASPLFPVEHLAPAPSDDPTGAACLARRFRALAAAFSALIHQASASFCFASRPDPGRWRCGRPHAGWLNRLLALQPRYADTS